MSASTDLTEELMATVGVLLGGDRALAREHFGALWARAEGRDRFVECVLCHYMADAQDEPAEELRWDRRALEAALLARAEPTSPSEARLGVTLATFFPSLHLNLAADLEALGDLELARAHLRQAQQALHALPDTGLGRLTRQAIERLHRRLDERG